MAKKLRQYEIYQQEMDSLLKDLFLNDDEKVQSRLDEKAEEVSLKIIKNSGKIYHMIKELGRRLLSSSNPIVNSGYNDLSNLL